MTRNEHVANKALVRSAGFGNNITINQHHHAEQPLSQTYTVFERDKSKGVEEYTDRQITKRALGGLAIGLGGLSIFADTLGVASYLGFTKLETVPIALVCLLLTSLNTKQILLWFLPKSETKDRYVQFMWWDRTPGKFVHKGSDGKYFLYGKSASCIYPDCGGIVRVVPPPPREEYNHAYIGQCSIGGMRHTYAVDANGIGYPHDFDWRPLTGN